MSSICIKCKNPSQDPIICDWCQTKMNFDYNNIINYIINQAESINNKNILFGCDLTLKELDDVYLLFHSNTFKNFYDGSSFYKSFVISPICSQHEDGIALLILVNPFSLEPIIDWASFEMPPIMINSGIELLEAIKQIIEALSVSQETFDKKYNVKYKYR